MHVLFLALAFPLPPTFLLPFSLILKLSPSSFPSSFFPLCYLHPSPYLLTPSHHASSLPFHSISLTLLQGVMVRLMLVLAPVMCVLSGIGVSSLLQSFMRNLELFESKTKKAKRSDSSYPVKNEVWLCV